jgi:hypothetical protein
MPPANDTATATQLPSMISNFVMVSLSL